MSVGMVFHEQLECCLGPHSELVSVRLDSVWIWWMDGMELDRPLDENECSWGAEEPRLDTRKEAKDRRVLHLRGRAMSRRGWLLV